MTTKKADYIWFNGDMVLGRGPGTRDVSRSALRYLGFEGCVATKPTVARRYSATVNICSACMIRRVFIACRWPTALRS